jgi:hypothetical protein
MAQHGELTMRIILMFILFLLPLYSSQVLAQSVSSPDSLKPDSDHKGEALIIRQRAELFLTACVQHNWEKASSLVSITSPLIPMNDQTADDQLVGRLKSFEIWNIDGEDWPTAVVFGCARLSGRGHGTFEFAMTLVTDKEERKVYHFQFLHEDMESPPIKYSFRK